MKVFINYKQNVSPDHEMARQIEEVLGQRGHIVFRDQTGIEIGETWPKRIQEELAACDVMVSLISNASMQSTWVLNEIDEAKRLKKRLVPVLIDSIDPSLKFQAFNSRFMHILYYEAVGDLHRDAEAVADILAGTRVLRKVCQESTPIQQERATGQDVQLVSYATLFTVQSAEVFRDYVDRAFGQVTGKEPYYRLTATLLPLNLVSLRDKVQEIAKLVGRPPKFRDHGWDLGYGGRQPRVITIGIAREDMQHKHLRVLWNGHTEFWTEVDEHFFRLSGNGRDREQVKHKFLYPYAISEPVENLALLMKEVCRVAGFTGEVEFTLGLYRIRGLYLAPGHPGSTGYRLAQQGTDGLYGAQPFAEDDLLAFPVKASRNDLPDQVTWRVVSQVYQRFGHLEDKMVPFFDGERKLAMR